MKRTFLKVFVTVCFSFLCQTIGFAQEGGYVSNLSVAQGEKLDFYLSTSVASYDLPIYKLGITKTLIFTFSLTGGIQPVPDSSYRFGCNWQKSVGFTIPDDWTPGVYEADLPTSQGIKPIIFVVRPNILGSYSKVVVCLTTNTWQAYNNWGGKSLYNYNSTDKTESVKVSFNRPFSDTASTYYYQWADKLVRWLEKEKIPVEFCVSTDLDRDPKFLDHYTVYTTVGHDEYWSHPERDQFEQFLSRGGKMVVLSGNTSWWQVRFEDGLKTIVVYRDYSKDPFFPSNTSHIASVWGRYPIFEPENLVIGVSFENGGYVNDGSVFPPSGGYGGYTVYNSRHWIYKNCDVSDGDIIDSSDAIVGYETDGALFKWSEGVPVPTTIDKTPQNFRILGVSPAAGSDGTLRGHATMGYYAHPGGGGVFTSASINWVNGLAGKDSVVEQMLRNVYGQFLSKKSLPPDIVAAEPVFVTHSFINHDSAQFSRRSFTLDYTKVDTFVVHAVDPLGKKLFYSWRIGEKIEGKDSVLILTPSVKKLFPRGIALDVFVNNGTDTVSTEWTLVTAKLSIVSDPPLDTVPVHSQYNYNAKAVSAQNAHIMYSLFKSPKWLHVNSKGIIYGKLDTLIGTYVVSLRAADKYGNADSQKFTIHIIDTLTKKDTTHKDTTHHQSVSGLSGDTPKLQCYPNPFSERSNIIVTLSESRVEIEIFDVTGKHITTVLPLSELTSGSHTFVWNRMTDDYRKVSGGIYFCRMTIRTSSGKNMTLVEKLVVM